MGVDNVLQRRRRAPAEQDQDDDQRTGQMLDMIDRQYGIGPEQSAAMRMHMNRNIGAVMDNYVMDDDTPSREQGGSDRQVNTHALVHYYHGLARQVGRRR